ncbi:RNA polymerase-binding protein RbpA [Saccharothrix xinjiangensis]|uniref:RNA polymerase-binding protein RbpA n=2 Tax=Saccharothrix xinjiangensis TaxID=204798 RepID=A0ABV9Y209_9PSEU
MGTLYGQEHGSEWVPGTGPSGESFAGGSGSPGSGRSPWHMLRERRSIPELEKLLEERLTLLYADRAREQGRVTDMNVARQQRGTMVRRGSTAMSSDRSEPLGSPPAG